MAAEHHKPGKRSGQAHEPQRRLRIVGLFVERQARPRDAIKAGPGPSRRQKAVPAEFLDQGLFLCCREGEQTAEFSRLRWPLLRKLQRLQPDVFQHIGRHSAVRHREARPQPTRDLQPLFSRNHVFGFLGFKFVDRQRGGHRRDHALLQPRCHPVVPARAQCLSQEGQREEPADGFHHDIRRDHIVLEVLEQVMAGLDDVCARLVPLDARGLIGSRHLPDQMFRLQEDGAQLAFVRLIQRPV